MEINNLWLYNLTFKSLVFILTSQLVLKCTRWFMFFISAEVCQPLNVINGEVTSCDPSSLTVGTLCNVECDPGYSIDSYFYTCQTGDIWSGAAVCIGENVISYILLRLMC